MKLLFAGHVGYNIIAPLSKLLKSDMPGVSIGVLGLNNLNKKTNSTYKFDEEIEFPKWTKKQITSVLFKVQFIKSFLPKLLKFSTYRHLKHAVVSTASMLLNDDYLKRRVSAYDIVHFQYIAENSYRYLKYVNQNQKVILTFWGSDLMQTSGLEIYAKQIQLIERANIITLHSIEMREIFLSKYGRQYFHKIRLNHHGLGQHKYDYLDEFKKNTAVLTEFKKKFSIPNNKLNILVGYSAAKGQQHLQVLDELERQSKEIKDKIHLLIPMTYNNEDKEYNAEVKAKIKMLSISYTHFTEYMSNEDIACLYSVSDVFINVRTTDAFNGTMIECLYLDKIGIVGSWLPYGLMRKAGIKYLEVDSVEEVTEKISLILKGKVDLPSNKSVMYKLTCNKYSIPKWCAIYKELYNK